MERKNKIDKYRIWLVFGLLCMQTGENIIGELSYAQYIVDNVDSNTKYCEMEQIGITLDLQSGSFYLPF